MASTPLRLGLRILGQKPQLLRSSKATILEIRCAGISSKAMRGEGYEKPKPWPYLEKGYTNLHAFFDKTTWRMDENSKIILIEGPPCIGMTEVAETLAKELDMKHVPRSTLEKTWINDYGFDLRTLDHKLPESTRSFDIDGFIKDPKHMQVPYMQFMLYKRKLKDYVDALAHVLNTGEGVVMERSVYSDLAFFEAMYATGLLNKWERKGYYKWRDRTLCELMKPHLVIYLDASPETVLENLKRRGKGEEKVYNKEFLEKLERYYKHQFLQSIESHAEVLVYDWNVPGDPEIIVEDIENIDFDRFEILDPKMGDWRLKEEWDYCEKRWMYTSVFYRAQIENRIDNYYIEHAPRMFVEAEDAKKYNDIVAAEGAGHKYAVGYNPAQGDSIWFKLKKYPFGLPPSEKAALQKK